MPSRGLYSPNIVRLVHVHLQDFVAVRVRACLTIAFPLTTLSSFPLHFTLTDAFTRRLAYQPALRHDMENAPTAIMLSHLRTFQRTVGRIARIPDDHVTSGHLNGLRLVTPSDMVSARCQAEIMGAQSDFEAASGVHIILGLVEGCLLYWDQVYTPSCYYLQFRTDEFFHLRPVPRKSSILLTPGYFFVGHTMCRKSGDHNVNI